MRFVTWRDGMGALHRTQESDVRFGSKADIRAAKRHVRFTPKSGHVRCNSACPLCANSGHHAFDGNYAFGAGSAEDGFWPSPIVSAVSPAMLPSCMLSTAVLGTMTIVEFCFSPSYSMFIARKWNAFGLLA